MADGTAIEWTDATLNVVNGCSVVSPGCTNCYAMRAGGRNLPNHPATGLTKPSNAGHVWTGEVRFNETALLQPLRWKRPRKIFWNAHGDLFHENVPDEWIDRCFAVMALTPQHVHQVLTKRPERMKAYLSGANLVQRWAAVENVEAVSSSSTAVESFRKSGAILHAGYPLRNVWLGVSVEDQKRADERIPILLDTPAAVRWISGEPLLGPLYPQFINDSGTAAIDWIVVGGESGPGARPMHPDWARSLRDQCADAGVPFLFKQWGEWLPVDSGHPDFEGPGFGAFDHCRVNEPGNATHVLVGKKRAGRLLDGVQHDGYPA